MDSQPPSSSEMNYVVLNNLCMLVHICFFTSSHNSPAHLKKNTLIRLHVRTYGKADVHKSAKKLCFRK